MTNYLNEEDEENKYSSEEKISDETPQIEDGSDSTDSDDWKTDADEDGWEEEVRAEGDEISNTVEEPEDGHEENTNSISEPSAEEINAETASEEPKGFRVLSFEDFISNK